MEKSSTFADGLYRILASTILVKDSRRKKKNTKRTNIYDCLNPYYIYIYLAITSIQIILNRYYICLKRADFFLLKSQMMKMSMYDIIEKAWRWRWMFRSLPQTIYFKVHYLPFPQAKRLPILLYKPKLARLKGKINIICEPKFYIGILERQIVSFYQNSGIAFDAEVKVKVTGLYQDVDDDVIDFSKEKRWRKR